MERKFATKLSQLKPAAEARKQASYQLKENIQSSKLKQIDPVDYDVYIEQNSSNLRKDNCSKQLILLPCDDIYADDYECNNHNSNQQQQQESTSNDTVLTLTSDIKSKIINNNLFVNDCLQTYLNKKFEVKYKYHSFGGSYRQLPFYQENSMNFLESLNNLTPDNSKIIIPELSFEIDALDNPPNKCLENSHTKYSGQFEKQGWLNYKNITLLSENNKDKSFKRRYFHLRTSSTPFQSRANSLDNRLINNPNRLRNKTQPSFIYILECFKEVPGLKKNENPKYQIMFDANFMTIQKTITKYGPFSFEITETVQSSINTSLVRQSNDTLIQSHVFVADNQKQFDEWFTILENIVNSLNNKKSNNYLDVNKLSTFSELSSPSTASSSSQSHNSSSSFNKQVNSSLAPSMAKQEDTNSFALNDSGDSNEISMAINYRDQNRLLSDSNQQFINSFDLNKYLNENEEDLFINKSVKSSSNLDQNLITKNKIEQMNAFDLYPKLESGNFIDEETELECTWPEKQIGRKILLSCSNFKLNLNFPIISSSTNKIYISSIEKNGSISRNSINPELFFVTFALYDARNGQKISENFSWIPNYENFLNQINRSRSSISLSTQNKTSNSINTTLSTLVNQSNNQSVKKLFESNTSVFSLNGTEFSDNPLAVLNSELKPSFFSQLSKALFTLLDVHEEIYLVARIEKILDGNNLHSSIQPYLIQMNESNKIKAAIKLNKKMQQLMKTKLATYKQPFAWAAKPLYKRATARKNDLLVLDYELDNESRFQIFEQEAQHLSDDDLFKYLGDFNTRDKFLNKLTPIAGELKIYLNDFSANMDSNDSKFDKSFLINSCLNLVESNKKIDLTRINDYILMVDYFEPLLTLNTSLFYNLSALEYSSNQSKGQLINSNGASNSNSGQKNSTDQNSSQQNTDQITSEQKLQIKKAKLIKINSEYKSFLYVYPKFLKYDSQKTYSRARNILIKMELRDKDTAIDDPSYGLKCIFRLNQNINNLISENGSCLVSTYKSIITHHNKFPQFYDEIKILLPLNLHEKHHILFKFYHISCASAKQTNETIYESCESLQQSMTNTSLSSHNTSQMSKSIISSNKNIETLIGYAWLPIFKNGRLFNGEKQLPIAQTLPNNYLSFEQLGLGQSIGPSDIKWVENMKYLFKVNIVANSTVHTIDPHVANFYLQCEKLTQTFKKSNETSDIDKSILARNLSKYKAPILDQALVNNNVDQEIKNAKSNEIGLMVTDTNKEMINNSVKLPINMIWSKPVKEELSLSYHLKALHAAELPTVIKFMPTLLNRILNTLITTVSGDVAIHSVRALLHFVWQITSIGKIDNLKSFIKYIFFVDYTDYFNESQNSNFPTIHEQLILNLVILIKQNNPIQDITQINRLFKNCWFFLEITIKSLCLYTIQYKRYHRNSSLNPTFNSEFYNSVKTFYDLLVELVVKYGSQSTSSIKDPDFIGSYKSCNRSLAMFVKKSLNILNKKFLFNLISKYLDQFHLSDKNLFEIKYDFIRIICNHEHYISFSLPIRKAISNINEFADIKYEFILSDQFRQFHFLAGVLLSQLCVALNESKDQRKISIHIFRNILCKHSYDSRYNDKVKQARIVSLYLPFIDIMLDNLTRLTGNMSATGNAPKAVTQLTNQSVNTSDSTNVSRTVSALTSSTAATSCTLLPQTNPYNSGVSSASISNGSVYISNFENGMPRLSYDPLSVIAGIVNSNKLHEQVDSIIGTFSDSDSLSSADDFKQPNKRASSSIVTASTNTSDNTGLNSNSLNVNSSNLGSNDQQSIAKSYCMTRKDKLETNEIKDLLICIVYILRNISDDALLGLWFNYDDNEFVEFLTLLELCLTTFRYRGKTYIYKLNAISKGQDFKALNKLPLPKSNNNEQNSNNRNSNSDIFDKIANGSIGVNLKNESSKNQSFNQQSNQTNGNNNNNNNGSVSNGQNNNMVLSPLSNLTTQTSDMNQLNKAVLIEANLCHQISLVVINILSLFLIHQKDKICENYGDNLISKKLVDIYFYLLQSNQSEIIKLKVFTSLRLLINKTPSIFLDGNSSLCSNLCFELLKCFNSKFESIRVEACVVIYLLLRKNYEHTKLKSISRVHSQTIISVSQLIGNMKLSSNNQVLECLSILNHLAFNDQIFLNTRFALEVDDLTKRIRNIFMATSQMKSFQDDTEMLIDSQYSLAKSYANCLELRRTWLESMATIHVKDKNYSEAAHCYLHIAALVAENLKHQGMYTLGCAVFKKITPNIELEEEINKNNDIMLNGDNYGSDLNEIQYTQSQLLDYLCKSADMLKLAERYDFLPDIFKLAVAIYEPNRDYEHLQQMHQNIQKAYSYLAERDQGSKEKPLAAYYRVSYYGKMFEQENNKVYIYKEPASTKLFEICDRLRKIYSKRFGSSETVEILSDSRKPTELKLDTNNKNYIQVTYVQPYFEENELETRISFFDKNNNLKKFYYETPYQLKDDESSKRNSAEIELQPQQHSELLKLCKRKIILETSNWFPYVKKRILVIYEMPIELNPMETAIDEIKQKIEDFEVILKKKDLTLLELYLQGGIMPQVHKGPLAYAEAFLDPNEFNSKYPKELKKKFKMTFKRLVDLYKKGIESYYQLALKLSTNETDSNNVSKNSTANITQNVATSSTNSMNNANKYIEMYRLLQEKFNELENNFRNLLLVDGDFELYQQQLNTSSASRGQLMMDTSTLTSSQA